MFWRIHRELFVLSAYVLFGSFLASANEEPRFLFDTGSPPWKGERIPLPPGFARDLGWTGVEEIRFAPGMFQPDEPDFFSYILVFALQPDSDISEKGLKQELLTYYQGLSEAVMSNAGLDVNAEEFTIALEKAARENGGAPEANPKATAWVGTLNWVEPFATKKEQTLHFEVHTWKQGDLPVVLSCVSPVDPKANEGPWMRLREIRKSFRLE